MKTCETCIHFRDIRTSHGREVGDCRARPPRMLGEIDPALPSGVEPRTSVWPVVRPSDGCASHEPA